MTRISLRARSAFIALAALCGSCAASPAEFRNEGAQPAVNGGGLATRPLAPSEGAGDASSAPTPLQVWERILDHLALPGSSIISREISLLFGVEPQHIPHRRQRRYFDAGPAAPNGFRSLLASYFQVPCALAPSTEDFERLCQDRILATRLELAPGFYQAIQRSYETQRPSSDRDCTTNIGLAKRLAAAGWRLKHELPDRGQGIETTAPVTTSSQLSRPGQLLLLSPAITDGPHCVMLITIFEIGSDQDV